MSRARRALPGRSRVSYYPRFNTTAELTNHYYRARWYLPHLQGRCDAVSLFVPPGLATDPGPRPDPMCTDTRDASHIEIRQARRLGCVFAAVTSEVVLSWTSGGSPFVLGLLRILGVQVINVDTEDQSTTEYGLYCSLIWKRLLAPEERRRILSENETRFKHRAARIFANSYQRACVFGTGPSLEKADQFDFDRTLCIACNTIVQNAALLSRIKPEFVAAADVVSHLGVSKQSQEFRESLVRALGESDFLFVTTAAFGYLLTLNYPELKDRTILIDQTCDGPNYSLFERFEVPLLDSVLNMLMLPLAATFCNEIWLLGCDGHSPERNESDNWDFWSHADGAGYKTDLIASGHQCHPTFNPHREKNTFERYNSSIMATLETGETYFRIAYRTLFKSYTPGLAERSIPAGWLSETRTGDSRIALSDLGARLHAQARAADKEYHLGEQPTFIAINECERLGANRLHIAGWAFCPEPIDTIRLMIAGELKATAPLRAYLPERFNKFPLFNDPPSGFSFALIITQAVDNPASHLVVEAISRGRVISRKEIESPFK